MKNLIRYKSIVRMIFQDWIDGETDNDEFILALTDIETGIRNDLKNDDYSQGLWFKFFSGDTGATDISTINQMLTGSTNNNNFLIQCLNLAIDLNEHEIYFS